MEGMACTSSRSSSWAPCAWPGFCCGTWARSAPSSASAGRGLWPAPAWSSASVEGIKLIKMWCYGDMPSCYTVYVRSSDGSMSSAPGGASLGLHTQRFISVRWSRTRMENITEHECSLTLLLLLSSCELPVSKYLDVVDGMNVLHCLHHHFAHLNKTLNIFLKTW